MTDKPKSVAKIITDIQAGLDNVIVEPWVFDDISGHKQMGGLGFIYPDRPTNGAAFAHIGDEQFSAKQNIAIGTLMAACNPTNMKALLDSHADRKSVV